MSHDSLGEHGRALRDAFYPEADSLVEQLRLALKEAAAADDLAAASGITDPALVRSLAALGIRAETLAALTLIPLLEVAWADAVMSPEEQQAILDGAISTGLSPDGPSLALLRIWIEDPPPPDLLALWGDFIRALCEPLAAREREQLRETLLALARGVARASRGDHPTQSSTAEAAVLEKLATAFD